MCTIEYTYQSVIILNYVPTAAFCIQIPNALSTTFLPIILRGLGLRSVPLCPSGPSRVGTSIHPCHYWVSTSDSCLFFACSDSVQGSPHLENSQHPFDRHHLYNDHYGYRLFLGVGIKDGNSRRFDGRLPPDQLGRRLGFGSSLCQRRILRGPQRKSRLM